MHHENLASKALAPELMKRQRHVIKLINTVKSSALKTRLFRLFMNRYIQITVIFSTIPRGDGCLKATCLSVSLHCGFELRDFYTAIQGKAGKLLQQHVVSLAHLVTFLAD